MDLQFAALSVDGRAVRLEYAWVNRGRGEAPLIVFLHEALGSVSMWRDFPQRLCDACGCRGLVYSRRGHGRSTPWPLDEGWPLEHLEREARDDLPAAAQHMRKLLATTSLRGDPATK